METSPSRSTWSARPIHSHVIERTLYLAADPEMAYLITRDRTIPGDKTFLELAARRGGLPGGHAVAITVDEQLLRDEGTGCYLIAREHIGAKAIGRAFQPWHVDGEPDPQQRWGGYMHPVMSLTLRNLVGAETPGTLTRLEAPRVEARLVELDADPVTPTLDLTHIRELRRQCDNGRHTRPAVGRRRPHHSHLSEWPLRSNPGLVGLLHRHRNARQPTGRRARGSGCPDTMYAWMPPLQQHSSAQLGLSSAPGSPPSVRT